MVTIKPRFLNALEMISVGLLSISSESSATVRNSLTRIVSASSTARRSRSRAASTRLGASSRRCLRFLPPVFNSARTRWMFSATAASSTRRVFFFFLASFFPLARPSLV
jgi:hypothetical protein